MRHRWIAAGAFAVIMGCVEPLAAPQASPRQPTPAVREHVLEVLAIMQANSLHRRRVDWTAFRQSVFDSAAAGTSDGDAIARSIRAALRLLGDEHSTYRATDGTTISVRNRTCRATPFAMPVLPLDIGYVRVGSYVGTSALAGAYVDSIQAAIRARDRDDLQGWIVDLRGNVGGNMWPMVAAVGPIIGAGVVGWFLDPDGLEIAWEVRDGASWLGGAVQHRVPTPYSLRRPAPRVAVLVDNAVTSSGEATFIAFRGRPDTRAFGVATCGLSTGNRGWSLANGAFLNLTTVVLANRAKTPYGDQVAPDEVIEGDTAVVARAVTWLRSGAAMRGIATTRTAR